MKIQFISASIVFVLLSGCSGPASTPSTGTPPPLPGSATRPMGEGATWDNINRRAGGAGTADSSSPSLLKSDVPPQIQSANFVAGAGSGGDAIAVVATTVNSDSEPVTIEYAWTVNGEPAGNGSRLEKGVRRGDFVTVTLTPFDSNHRGRSVTIRSQVNNSPPRIDGLVDSSQAGDIYTARIQASDPDGDVIRFALVSGPSGMSVDPVEGLVKWVVPGDFKGNAVLMVSARDKNGAQSTHAATVTVGETFE